jgi:hypothetical protein
MVTNDTTATAAIERKTKILRITLALTLISFITFIIILTSSHWVVITYPPNFFATRQKMFVVRSTYGIIWECVFGRTTINSTFGKH